MAYGDATDKIGTERVPLVGVLVHELPGSFWIVAAALHDLHEARLVGIALNINGDVGAVTERGFPVEELRGLGPPLVLLGPIAVAAGILLGFEAHNRDGPTIFSDAARAPKPASRARRKILEPTIESGIQRLRVGRPALDNLNEHAGASDQCLGT